MTRRAGRSLMSLAVLVLLASPVAAVRAQRVSASLELGGASMRYADTVSASAAVFSPSVTFRWPRTSLGAAASVSQVGPGGWTSQGALAASTWFPLAGPVLAELSAAGGGSSHQDGARTTQALATGRLYLVGASAGAWAGGGGGGMSDGITPRAVRLGELGAWVGHAGRMFTVSASPTAVDDSIRYTDLTGMLQSTSDRVELTATLGMRSGAHIPTLGGRATTWGSVAAVAWLTPRAGLTVSAGTYPVDLTQGFPGGRFAAIGARIRWKSRPAADDAVAPGAATGRADIARDAVTDFAVARAAGRHRVLRVRAPSADRVELSGDFTGWRPVALSRAGDGWWNVDVELNPGVHQVNVRVNGGAWLVPPGLTPLKDEFGGVVGLLVIE